jgi:hypothetical protein
MLEGNNIRGMKCYILNWRYKIYNSCYGTFWRMQNDTAAAQQ